MRAETNTFLFGPSKQLHETALQTFDIDQEDDTSWDDTETNYTRNQNRENSQFLAIISVLLPTEQEMSKCLQK